MFGVNMNQSSGLAYSLAHTSALPDYRDFIVCCLKMKQQTMVCGSLPDHNCFANHAHTWEPGSGGGLKGKREPASLRLPCVMLNHTWTLSVWQRNIVGFCVTVFFGHIWKWHNLLQSVSCCPVWPVLISMWRLLRSSLYLYILYTTLPQRVYNNL